MNVKRIEKRLKKKGLSKFGVSFDKKGIVLSGESESWDEIVRAGLTAAERKSGYHVINNIKYTGGEIPPMKTPELCDSALEGKSPDVLVIGAGIVGASIARELSKWKLNILMVEKGCDVALGASGRNDGCVHPGIDLMYGTLKQKYNLLGNRMFDKVTSDLDVEFQRVGQIVMFPSAVYVPLLWLIGPYWRIMGLKNVKVLTKKELFKREPLASPEMKCGLFFPTGGIVCPYNLTIAYAENAVQNGAELSLNTAVTGMEVKDGEILSVTTNRGRVFPKVVVNAAGVFSDTVASMAGDGFFSIHPRKGTNSILDRKAKRIVNTSFSRIGSQSKSAHTKGGGIVSTIDKNVLIGPDAVETPFREDLTANAESIARTFEKQSRACPDLSRGDIITYFSGIRAATYEEDFIVEKGRSTRNIVHAAGIQSPGLTAAPAIALEVERLCIEALNGIKQVEINKEYNEKRTGIPKLSHMSDEERAEYIKKNPDYGEIICRCEEVSRGEILDALRRPVPCDTVDGVKRRVRPGMGRCQGGFCGPLVAEIIAKEKGIALSDVKKSGEGSGILFGPSKEGETK